MVVGLKGLKGGFEEKQRILVDAEEVVGIADAVEMGVVGIVVVAEPAAVAVLR